VINLPPKLPKAALRMVAMAKAAASASKERDDSEVVKAKVRSTALKTKINKCAKDDLEVLEMRRKKMNKDIAPALEKVKLQKRAKDDSELLSMARKLQNIRVEGIKDDKAIEHVKKFQVFFKIVRSKIKNNDSVVQLFDKLDNILSKINPSTKFNIIKELEPVVEEIYKNYKEGG
jgi:hypothetical protein